MEHLPRRRAPLAITVAALVALLLALWSSWSLYDTRRQLQALAASTDGRLGELAQREDQLSAQDRQLGKILETLAAGQDAAGKRLDALGGARRSGLLAAEAEHLARLAAQRLALMQDPAGALALLSAADAALRDIRDADTHAARAALAADMAPLRSAGAVDIEALYLRLGALGTQADALDDNPDVALPPPPVVEDARPPAAWDRLLHTLSTLVTIRRLDEPATPLVAPGERALAVQHFRLLLDQAQLALLQRRPVAYADALARADDWLGRLVGGDAARRNAMHRELNALRAVDIGTGLPDLTRSLTATRALAARLLPDAAP